MARATQQPQENRKTRAAWYVPCLVTGCGKGERDIAGLRTRERWVADSAEQEPRGIKKPVAMEWSTMGQTLGAWPQEVLKMP